MIQALGILRRRWYLTVLGLILTVGLAVLAAYRLDDGRLVSRFEPQYESAAVVSVAADDLAVADGGVIQPGAAPRVAHSLKAIVESPPFAARIADEVAGWQGGSIRASVPQQTTLVQLLVTAPSPEAAAAAMRAVIDALPETATGVVDGSSVAGGGDSLAIDVTGEPTSPAERSSAKGPLAFGLMLSLGIAATWLLVRSVDAAAATRPAVARLPKVQTADGRGRGSRSDTVRQEPAAAGVRS